MVQIVDLLIETETLVDQNGVIMRKLRQDLYVPRDSSNLSPIYMLNISVFSLRKQHAVFYRQDYKGTQLTTVADYGIKPEDTLHVLITLCALSRRPRPWSLTCRGDIPLTPPGRGRSNLTLWTEQPPLHCK